MNSDNRWIYIGGVAVLAVLVLVGVLWPRDEPRAPADGGASSRNDASQVDASTGDAGAPRERVATGDGGAPTAPATGTMAPPPGDAGDDIGDVPSDPQECRAYCRDLAERGALASGATADTCIENLCASEEAPAPDAAPAPRVETMTEPDVPELPDDCEAQCAALHERGELRAGMTVAQCIAAMCSAPENDEDGGETE